MRMVHHSNKNIRTWLSAFTATHSVKGIHGPWGVHCACRDQIHCITTWFQASLYFPQPQNEFEVSLSVCTLLFFLSCLFRGLCPLAIYLPVSLRMNCVLAAHFFMSSSCALLPSLPLASRPTSAAVLPHESPLMLVDWCNINNSVQGHVNTYHKCTQMHPILVHDLLCIV